eukprot:IDg9347t1
MLESNGISQPLNNETLQMWYNIFNINKDTSKANNPAFVIKESESRIYAIADNYQINILKFNAQRIYVHILTLMYPATPAILKEITIIITRLESSGTQRDFS